MNCPPEIMRLRVSNKQRKRLSLWIPLFPMWLILAIFVIALSPLLVLLVLVLWPVGWGKVLLFSGPRIASCLCALRGLEVNVQQGDRLVFISFK